MGEILITNKKKKKCIGGYFKNTAPILFYSSPSLCCSSRPLLKIHGWFCVFTITCVPGYPQPLASAGETDGLPLAVYVLRLGRADAMYEFWDGGVRHSRTWVPINKRSNGQSGHQEAKTATRTQGTQRVTVCARATFARFVFPAKRAPKRRRKRAIYTASKSNKSASPSRMTGEVRKREES